MAYLPQCKPSTWPEKPCPPPSSRQLQQLPQIQHIYNLYGPSEDTTYSTWAEVTDLDATATRVSIGRPIANSQVYILDDHLQPVPIGVSGELHIGGDGLARGYLNRPELTQERFVPNLFSVGSCASTRPVVYKTGDRCRYRSDGNLEFLGRLDHQVKIRGFRIETGEIEAVLTQHSSILEAVVVARGESPDVRLVAYLTQAPKSNIPLPELRLYLAEQLPSHMLPTDLIELEALPRLPNGKVDRRSLPAPEGSQRESTPLVAPRTGTEQTLAEIWRRELKLEQVSIYDNFFELGGHSLLGMRIIAQAERRLACEIPLKALFQTRRSPD